MNKAIPPQVLTGASAFAHYRDNQAARIDVAHEAQALRREEERRADDRQGRVVAVVDRDEECPAVRRGEVEEEGRGLALRVGRLPRRRGGLEERSGGLGPAAEGLAEDRDAAREDP